MSIKYWIDEDALHAFSLISCFLNFLSTSAGLLFNKRHHFMLHEHTMHINHHMSISKYTDWIKDHDRLKYCYWVPDNGVLCICEGRSWLVAVPDLSKEVQNKNKNRFLIFKLRVGACFSSRPCGSCTVYFATTILFFFGKKNLLLSCLHIYFTCHPKSTRLAY